MNWHNQSIQKLSDDDLKAAQALLTSMSEFRQSKLDAQQERHAKFDLSNINPVFEQLKSEINTEISKRNLA